MSALKERIYRIAPVWLQNAGITAFGLAWRRRRFGGVFREALGEFQARGAWSSGRWMEYQTAQLRDLLLHASATVPYYRRRFAESGITKEEIRRLTTAELGRLPLTDKEDIRSNLAELTSEAFCGKKLYSYLTSGSTGTPLAVLFSREMHQTWSAAYEARCRAWAGVSNSMSRAMIGGRLVVPNGQARPPFWRYNRVERQLYMSAFHISAENAPAYVGALNERRPDYLVGYASSHYFLARFINELGLAVHRPKAVLTSSEKLLPEMRQEIEKAYRCEVFDAYSGVEACCLASECERHRLHTSPDVGIIELCDDTGRPVPAGVPGEIVATGLLNFAQPLIRYRTGDIAVRSDEVCTCGREMPVLAELVGRFEDTVIGPDGREMVRFHGIFVGLPHVREGQVVQETLTEFRVRLVADAAFDERDRSVIVGRFKERLGEVQVAFDLVNQIERTERGKFRAVISKVRRQRGGH